MNRAERRRNAVTAKPKTDVLNEDQILQMKREIAANTIRKAFLMFMSIPVMVLHDKFSFDESQLSKFMDYALIWSDSVQNDETRLMELVKVASEECGINVTDYERGKQHD